MSESNPITQLEVCDTKGVCSGKFQFCIHSIEVFKEIFAISLVICVLMIALFISTNVRKICNFLSLPSNWLSPFSSIQVNPKSVFLDEKYSKFTFVLFMPEMTSKMEL